MTLKVCKFGGTSVANASQLKKVGAIINSDDTRRIIVVSAPGKEHPEDTKLTDLLLVCYDLLQNHLDITPVFSRIRERFTTIAHNLGVTHNVDTLLDRTEHEICENPHQSFIASRGEYLCAKIVAEWLNATYVEPAENIFFDASGHISDVSYVNLEHACEEEKRYVIPGYYGTDIHGRIKTFSRGGSDITGAIVARAVSADVYENWTDVSGFFMADPRVVTNPKRIDLLTYHELRELSYMGANVLHDEAIFPVFDSGIPIEIRNTNDPDAPATRIVSSRLPKTHVVTGIAGRKDFVMFQIEKYLMNRMVGFGRRLLEIFESFDISYDHTPSSIDSMSVVVHAEALKDNEQNVIDEINKFLSPDSIEVTHDLAIIATVGEGMVHHVGTSAKLFAALAEADVNVRIIDQGASELNIIVGVANEQYETAITAIHHAFA